MASLTWLLTLLALAAFAANSVICRTALGRNAIDAADFTLIRLASGALMLVLLTMGSRKPLRFQRDFIQPAMLFVYAAAFSFAYLSLGAGTGALILFACVQTTMLVAAIRSGERLTLLEVAGLVTALGGLAYLVAPGVTAPAPIGSALMASAGVAWGIYSLRGRGSVDPLGDTTRNFIVATPIAAIVAVFTVRTAHFSPVGTLLAVLSGAITSGLGYVVWFTALRGLTSIRAAIVQLVVPAIAAVGGAILLGERISLRMVLATALILGGVGLAIATRSRRSSA